MSCVSPVPVTIRRLSDGGPTTTTAIFTLYSSAKKSKVSAWSQPCFVQTRRRFSSSKLHIHLDGKFALVLLSLSTAPGPSSNAHACPALDTEKLFENHRKMSGGTVRDVSWLILVHAFYGVNIYTKAEQSETVSNKNIFFSSQAFVIY